MIKSANFLILFTVSILVVGVARPAFGQIAISPLRTVMTEASPQTNFIISNPTQRLMEGRVSLIDLSATPTGYEPASPTARSKISAAPWLSVSPISFTLEPGQKQTVTVRMRQNLAPPTIEHRSHLYIEANPARKNIHRINDGGLGLDVSLGISVPVIIRAANTPLIKPPNHPNNNKTTTPLPVQFTDTKLIRTKDNNVQVNIKLRFGPLNNSLFGQVNIIHKTTSPPFVTKELVKIENIASYTDSNSRSINLPLGLQELPEGELIISYVGRGEYEGQLFGKKNYSVGDK